MGAYFEFYLVQEMVGGTVLSLDLMMELYLVVVMAPWMEKRLDYLSVYN